MKRTIALFTLFQSVLAVSALATHPHPHPQPMPRPQQPPHAPQKTTENQLTPGCRIINDVGRTGTLVQIFANKKGQVRFDDDTSTLEVELLEDLSKGVNCHKDGICKNQTVLTEEGEVGTVLELFENGSIFVQTDNYAEPAVDDVSTAGRDFFCVTKQICRGMKISHSFDDDDAIGTILKVFDNGWAQIRFDGKNQLEVLSFRELGFDLQCSDERRCRGYAQPQAGQNQHK